MMLMKPRYRLHLACRIVADKANGRERANIEASPERAIAQAWQDLANQHRSQFPSTFLIMFEIMSNPSMVPSCVSAALSLSDLARLRVVSHGGPAHGHTIPEIFS